MLGLRKIGWNSGNFRGRAVIRCSALLVLGLAASVTGPNAGGADGLAGRAAALGDGDDVVFNVDESKEKVTTVVVAAYATCYWANEVEIQIIDGREVDVGEYQVLVCSTDGHPLSARAEAARGGARRRRGPTSAEENFSIASSMVEYSTPLISPTIVTNPPAPSPLLVGLPTWFSLGVAPTTRTGMRVRINDVGGGGYEVVERLVPLGTIWQVGSGKRVLCDVNPPRQAPGRSRTTSCSFTPQKAGGSVAVLGGVRYRREIVDPSADRFSRRNLPGALAVRGEIRCILEVQQVARPQPKTPTCR